MPHLGKPADQSWSGYLRQILAFALGAALIIHAVIGQGVSTVELVVGLLLMGVVPVDTILERVGLNRRNGRTANPPPAGS